MFSVSIDFLNTFIYIFLQLTHAEQKIQRLNQQLKELKLSSLGATPESKWLYRYIFNNLKTT